MSLKKILNKLSEKQMDQVVENNLEAGWGGYSAKGGGSNSFSASVSGGKGGHGKRSNKGGKGGSNSFSASVSGGKGKGHGKGNNAGGKGHGRGKNNAGGKGHGRGKGKGGNCGCGTGYGW